MRLLISTNQFVLESNGVCGVVGDANRATNGAGSNGQGPGGDAFFIERRHHDPSAGGRLQSSEDGRHLCRYSNA